MQRIAPFLLLPLALAGQPPQGAVRVPGRQRPGGAAQEQPAAVKPEDLCTVAGQVVNGATGEPLGKATVRLRRADAPAGGGGLQRTYSGGSDPAGRFTVSGVAPGKYRLSASRTGFVDSDYGSGDPQRAGTVFSLAAKQQLGDLLFRMTPHAVITGRVLDQDGEPMESLQVTALRYRYVQGRKQMASYGEDSTNDIGEYRVYGLPPGRYYICVSPRRSFRPDAGSERADEEYVPTFFPGTIDAAAAAPVDAGPGAQLRGFDLRLSKHRTVKVAGRVTDTAGAGRQRLSVMLAPAQATGPASMRRAPAVGPDGSFEIRGVVPGAYTLVASVFGRGQSLTARLPVQVGDANLDNVALAISPAVNASGRIRIDGQTTVALTGIQVTLRSRDPNPAQFASAVNAKVNEEGAFTLENVNPDHYNVVFSGLPDGTYVKAAAANGQDVLAAGLDLSRGGAGPLDVVLSPHAGQAAGVAQNDRQEPAVSATVVLVPREKERLDQPQFYRTATTDATGHFTYPNLAPGGYKVYAWQDVESGAWMDPDFMKPLESRGEPVTIREDGREDVPAKLIG